MYNTFNGQYNAHIQEQQGYSHTNTYNRTFERFIFNS